MKNSRKLSLFLMWAVTVSVRAEVVTDGTVGAVQSLSGQMTIPQSLGTTAGNNLFHSFQTFNINTDESATFTGADSIKNVISRVTGGQVSNIDGLLKSEIPNANFYFINPAGVTFGWNATVDVPAAFHISTANSLKFADGTEFSASNPTASVLTIAEPISFGFLGNQTADINIYNWFQFNNGNDVSFSASHVQFDYAWLDNPYGSVGIYATGDAPAELPFNTPITIAAGEIKFINESRIDTGAGGNIHIQGGNILLDNSAIRSRSDNSDNAGNVSIIANDLNLLNGGEINTNASDTGAAGSITATAKTISIDSGSSISSVSQAGSSAGGILLHTDSLQNNGTIQGFLSGDNFITVTAQIVTDGSQGTDQFKGEQHSLSGQQAIVAKGYGITSYLYDQNTVVEHHFESFYLGASFFTIPQEMGTTVGDNLFHSFSVFNINQNEAVTFSGADSLKNVISRVTGGEVSTINGLFKSEIPNANVYFINPAGVTFGAHAHLDVPAAFHLSTADSVKFADGYQFSATNLANNQLSIAEPKSFVFLDSSVANIGNITIDGCYLDVREGKTLDMVANNFEIKNTSYLTAPAGEMRLVAFKNTGEVSVEQDDTGKLSLPDATPSAMNAGKISLDSSYVYSDGNRGGGHTALWANEIVLDHGSAVAAWNYSDDNATSSQGIEVQAHEVNLYNQSYISTAAYAGGNAGMVTVVANALGLFDGGSISANTYAAGSAGIINLNADTIDLSGDRYTGVFSETTQNSTGDGGVININSNVMNILGSSRVSAGSYSDKNAGTINLTANNTLMINDESGYLPGILAESNGVTGAGGNINIINHGRFDITGGLIAVSGLGTGHSGSITISAGEFNLSSSNNVLSAEAVHSLKSSGASGNISITADSLNLSGLGHLITTSTFYGDADAGNIDIHAKNISLDNASNGILAKTEGAGNAGKISISAETLDILNQGRISASTFSSGNAGVVDIAASTLNISGNERTGVFVETQAGSSGQSGLITVTSNTVNILGSSRISAGSYSDKNAGTINLTANNTLMINDEAGYLPGIWAESNGGAGAGGNINIINHGRFDIAGGLIAVSGLGTGHSGSITISAGEFNLSSRNNVLSAEAVNSLKTSGASGNINITADSLSLNGSGHLITTSTFYGDADAGNIEIDAKNIILTTASNGILAKTEGAGNAGTITITARDNGYGNLKLLNGSKISTNSRSTGNAGNIFIDADNLTIHGTIYDADLEQDIISSEALSMGGAGHININADTLDIQEKGRISASSFASGNAGAINIITDFLTINGNQNVGVFVETQAGSSGEPGTITVDSNTLNILGGSRISAGSDSSSDAGTINITANDLLNIDSINGYRPGIWAESKRDIKGEGGNAGNITIKNSGTISINGGLIAASGLGSGHSGNIDITAGTLTMNSNDYVISSEAVNSLKSHGASGNIVIKADAININGGGTFITTSTYNHDADAGDITVTAKNITLDGGSQAILSKTYLWYRQGATGTGTGNAGKVTINATDNGHGTLNILNGSRISTEADTVGNGGNIIINTDTLNMSGAFSKVSSNTLSSGKAGSVEVTATKNINLYNGAEISSSTFGSGKAGDVTVKSPNIVLDNAEISALAGASSGGETGKINVNAGTLDLINSGKISIQNDAVADGSSVVEAGVIKVTAVDISLKNSLMTAQSTGNVDAGEIVINFSHQLYLDPSYITTSAYLGNGGNIFINSDNGLIHLQNSGFFTSVTGATGNGGNINVSANTLIMDNGAIQANAVLGSGGDINLNLKALIPTQNQLIKGGTQVVWQPFIEGFNVIQAASASGINGSVNISSPQFNISGSISGLDSEALMLPIIDHSLCQGSTIPASSLVNAGKGGIPDDGLQFSFIPTIEMQKAPPQAQSIITTYSTNAKVKSTPCAALKI